MPDRRRLAAPSAVPRREQRLLWLAGWLLLAGALLPALWGAG
jgi:hypothetical protein